MDDATSDIYSAFFVAEEGTMSSFQGVSEAIWAKGLFCSLYADRASHYWNTTSRPARPRPRAIWVLPVPLLPSAMTFSRRSMYSQRASSRTIILLSDGMALKSKLIRCPAGHAQHA